ncbi:CLUMA_CG018186, isoform B [Clunio marinus]|uniref:CLUMA_CG018186, isoform B n=1 Tax=Clunio marinus TaxID=568069 RepID=A0A1J1J0Z7_9DIPT|nr:CLUMA_CG018186, isoform B [Clunio marinus]
MAICILRSLARSSLATTERIALFAPTTTTLQSKWKANLISTSSDLRCSNKGNQLKSSNIFDQARAFSERSNVKKKNSRKYVSDSDSDSDAEVFDRKKKAAYSSEFWRQKMRTMHGIFDVNNDGVISFEDFIVLAENFGKLGHLSTDEMNEFREVMRSTWESNWGEITPYNLVTVEQYLNDMHHVMTDKDLRKKVHRFLPYLFQAVDKDSSGEISIEEFKLFFQCLGLTDRDAEISFNAIDKNHDGMLSIKEFVKLGRDFFLTEDPKRVSKNFWGPLVSTH